MLDNPLITLILQTVIAQESNLGIAGTPIAQAFQPTQQGVNNAQTGYIYKISDHRYGSPSRTDVWDPVNQIMNHVEMQQLLTTFQMSALSIQNPQNQSQYTASDIVNSFAAILQSDQTIQALKTQDVWIMRITDVRNPYFKDDKGRFEASPSFDFTVNHKQIVTTSVPVIQSTEFKIYQV